ncbi:MAG: TorF family putative porin [Luteimonas sp.]
MLRGVIALMALLSAAPACAQLSGSAALLSDYRYRGVSLSDGKPAAQLGLTYDFDDGIYAGLLFSSTQFAYGRRSGALLLPYVGYAKRLNGGLSWEVGAQYSRFTGTNCCGYAEIYAGFGSDHLYGRLYYSPDYFGRASTLYAELDGNRAVGEHWRAFAHAGLLRFNDIESSRGERRRYRYDLQAGFALDLHTADVQLSWSVSGGGDGRYCAYPCWDATDRSGWMLALTHRW